MAATMSGTSAASAMASKMMLSTLVLLSFRAAIVGAQLWAATDWTAGAHATFYGGEDASGTMGGACGYGNLYSTGYGTTSCALSNPLFNNGLTCGACFQLQCVTSQSSSCYSGVTITVTATNACPPGSDGGWCDDKPHFDLAYPMFNQLAPPVTGVVPVLFKRVACAKQGGIRFTVNGNPWFDNVLVTNVAGDGCITALYIQSDSNGWQPMSQNWGAYWQSGLACQGKSLSFRVVAGSGLTQDFMNVAPSDWSFGSTYEATSNMS
ncbi:unnamed protein product [Calypogeia fissa]